MEFENLIWLIFLVLWGIFKLFFDKGDADAKDIARESRENAGEEGRHHDSEERARRIQEEIRRKIAERRQREQQSQDEPPPHPTREPQRQSQPQVRDEPPPAPTLRRSSREAAGKAFHDEAPRQQQPKRSTYEERLEREMERLRESEQKSARMMRQAGLETAEIGSTPVYEAAAKDDAWGDAWKTSEVVDPQNAVTLLKAPGGPRQAIVLSEIIGKPRALQDEIGRSGM